MSFITRQIDMSGCSGLTRDQMVQLRREFGVCGAPMAACRVCCFWAERAIPHRIANDFFGGVAPADKS